MTITEQYTDMAGKIRMIVELTTGETIMLKFSEQPSTTALDEIEAKYIIAHEEDATQTMFQNLLDDNTLIWACVNKLHVEPTITITQFNKWLTDNYTWDAQTIIWYFLLKLRAWLEVHAGLVFDDGTQLETMKKCRNWIVGHKDTLVAKTIFGNKDLIF